MKLTQQCLNDSSLKDKGYVLPTYNVDEMKEETVKAPTWLHLGAGNIFRAFLASNMQQLLNEKKVDKGILVAEGFDLEIVDCLKKYENLFVNVTLKENGTVDKEIVASVADYLKMDGGSADFERLKTVFRAPSLQMVSLTITEKGYSLTDRNNEISEAVFSDFENGPEKPVSYIGKLVALVYERFKAGQLPLALVSMDNMAHNGEKLAESVLRFVTEWDQRKLVSPEFITYMNSDKVTFPWTMIDKITPRPDTSVEKMLVEDGLEDMQPMQTTNHSYVAPYVNGEETQYLIIEDSFPNGHPPLEETGILFTDRKTVNQVETMKVTTCLNPLHTALAIFGCLFGYSSIHEEMKDDDLVTLIKKLGYDEGLAVVTDPKIIEPKQFIDEVIEVRLPNPFMPDTPQRIATDTSQKLSVRFGETIKSYVNRNDLEVSDLEMIPLIIAGWLRYLTGIDDKGNPFEISPDPLLPELQKYFVDFSLGDKIDDTRLESLLRKFDIFGVDLVSVGLSDKIIALFEQLSRKKGAVSQTLHQIVTGGK